MLPLTRQLLTAEQRPNPSPPARILGQHSRRPRDLLPGAQPGATISLPPAWSFATVGSPFQPLFSSTQPDLPQASSQTQTHPVQPRPPDHDFSVHRPRLFSVPLSSRGGARAGERSGGAVWGRGKVSYTTSCLCPFWDNCCRGLHPLLPSPNLPGPPSL